MNTINVCTNCKKDISDKSDKAKYCSDKCSKAHRRALQRGAENNSDIKSDTDTSRTFDFDLTRTDRAFEKDYPNYYNFSKTVYDKKCFICEKDFKTRLKLLKFCSIKCRKEFYKIMSGAV